MKSEKNAAPPQNDSFEEDELPDGWERVSLSQISELIMGQSPPGSTYNTEGVGIPFFQGKTDFTEKSPIVRIWCTQPKKFAKSGDILISVRAPVGPTNIADRDCSIGRGLAAIRPKNGIPTEFILYYLKFKEPELALSGKGSTFTAIKKEDLTNLLIPLPPLPEQHRIVARVEALLTHVNAARERLSQVPLIMKRFRQGVLAAACSGRLTEGWREENPDVEPASDLLKNDNSDRKKKKRAGRLWGAGVIPELTDEECDLLPLSWTWTKVKEIGEDPDGTVQVGPMSMQSKTFTEKGVPVLNVGCVQWGYFDESKLNYMPEDLAQSFNRYKILKNDILFTRSGTVGRCAIASDNQNGYLMTFHLLRVRASEKKCLPEYLQFVFWGAPNIKRQTDAGVIGSTRAGFNTHLLANLSVPLPPLAEQYEIVRRVGLLFERADAFDQEVAAASRRCERLTQAVLGKAFSGKL